MVSPGELHGRLAQMAEAVPTVDALRSVMDQAARVGAETARRQRLSVRVSLQVDTGLQLRFSGKGAAVARDAAQNELARLLPKLSAELRKDLIRAVEGK